MANNLVVVMCVKQQKRMLYVSPEVGRLRMDQLLQLVPQANDYQPSHRLWNLGIKDGLCLDLFLHHIYIVALGGIPLHRIFHSPFTNAFSLLHNKPQISFRRLFIRRSISVPCWREIPFTWGVAPPHQ